LWCYLHSRKLGQASKAPLAGAQNSRARRQTAGQNGDEADLHGMQAMATGLEDSRGHATGLEDSLEHATGLEDSPGRTTGLENSPGHATELGNRSWTGKES